MSGSDTDRRGREKKRTNDCCQPQNERGTFWRLSKSCDCSNLKCRVIQEKFGSNQFPVQQMKLTVVSRPNLRTKFFDSDCPKKFVPFASNFVCCWDLNFLSQHFWRSIELVVLEHRHTSASKRFGLRWWRVWWCPDKLKFWWTSYGASWVMSAAIFQVSGHSRYWIQYDGFNSPDDGIQFCRQINFQFNFSFGNFQARNVTSPISECTLTNDISFPDFTMVLAWIGR